MTTPSPKETAQEILQLKTEQNYGTYLRHQYSAFKAARSWRTPNYVPMFLLRCILAFSFSGFITVAERDLVDNLTVKAQMDPNAGRKLRLQFPNGRHILFEDADQAMAYADSVADHLYAKPTATPTSHPRPGVSP